MIAESLEDSELLVVYRELFGDYRFWVGPTENFSATSDAPQFYAHQEYVSGSGRMHLNIRPFY